MIRRYIMKDRNLLKAQYGGKNISIMSTKHIQSHMKLT